MYTGVAILKKILFNPTGLCRRQAEKSAIFLIRSII